MLDTDPALLLLLRQILDSTAGVAATVAKLDDVTDTIRSDQISARREVDFVKQLTKETREMIDASAPVLQTHAKLLAEHTDHFDRILPLVPSMEELDTGLKGVKKGVKRSVAAGSVIVMSPYAPTLWGWFKLHFITPWWH